MPNPTVAKLREGIEIARDHEVDLLLAVGGGSVCDYLLLKYLFEFVLCDKTYLLSFENGYEKKGIHWLKWNAHVKNNIDFS